MEDSPLINFFHVYLQTINFDSPRGGISLVTEKGVLTTSRLLVQKAIPSDSGMINLFYFTVSGPWLVINVNGKFYKL